MIRTREFCKKTVTEELRPGDVVQHFKRGMTNSDDHNAYLYKIICEAIHTETKEPMVVYQALYGDCATYVRPKEMFLEKVDTKKYPDATQEYRFEKYAGIPRLKSEKEIPRELKHSPISLRILNALHTIGITRFSDFSNHTRDEIHAIPGIGPRAMLELDKELKNAESTTNKTIPSDNYQTVFVILWKNKEATHEKINNQRI